LNNSSKYDSRGVSFDKKEVHDAIKNIDKGLFPNAFCKIIPDLISGDDDYCIVMHADGAGTKSSLAYAYWKETGDLDVWKGISQDSLIMNIDDLICVGAIDNIIVSSTIGRNKKLIPGDVIKTIIEGNENIIVVQIAGLIARRIVTQVQKTQKIKQGERLGMIRFGSRVDIYFSRRNTMVKVGQNVIAGESLIARK